MEGALPDCRTGLVLHGKKDRHAESLPQCMGFCPGLHRRMRAIASVDSSNQGSNEVMRLPAQLAALLHYCGKGHRDMPTQLGGMWSLAPGGSV